MSFLQKPNRENELILNTPNRLEILKEGLPQNQAKTNLLGRGAYGTVIKAVYKAKAVAVKIIKNLQDFNVAQTALSEGNILGWSHPNIVRIFKIESTLNFSIVVMERFNGHCLQKVLDTIELPLSHRIFIALDILAGLIYCHKSYLLHLDIKPQNIMVQMIHPKSQVKLKSNQSKSIARKYKCKLCDFGSSIKITKEKPQTSGVAKGTVRYMAPEVLKEENLTAAADIYSLGITLWQIAYRLMPYYWLECNEIVAYQVVKHKLRPNALQADVKPLKKSCLYKTHDNCLCAANSNEISYHSWQNFYMLNDRKREKLSSAEYPLKRKPFKEYNFKTNTNLNQKFLNVKRDLQQDFTLIDTFCLMNVFNKSESDSSIDCSQQNEQRYEEIFKSCWHSDFTQRPTARQLFKKFKEIL